MPFFAGDLGLSPCPVAAVGGRNLHPRVCVRCRMRTPLWGLLLLPVLTACGGDPSLSAGTAQERDADSVLVERCFGAEPNVLTTDEYNEMSEDGALVQARTQSEGGGRVIARDDKCLGRSRDLRSGRVNFVVQDGVVVWAAVERLPS